MNIKTALIVVLIILRALCLPAFCIEVKAEPIDFVDADPLDIVSVLAERAGLNVVICSDSTIAGRKVTLHSENMNCLDAIDLVLRASGLRSRRDGNTILISTLPGEAVSELEKKTKRVLIESRIVEVSESGMDELGVKWGAEAGSLRFAINKDTGKIGLTDDILVTVQALASEGKADILAEPSITTLDGHEATINIGSRIPYAVPASSSSTTTSWTVQYIDAGVSLKINPTVEDDNFICVLLKPEVSSISEWRMTSAGEFPVITTRNAESQVRVKDGETIVIGGLTGKSERDSLSKIALLGDIPIVGELFTNRVKESSKTEVIFLITPHII